MSYQNFLFNIKAQLSRLIDKDITLNIQTITKNNGTHYDGLVLLNPEYNISPTIYLQPYYHRFLNGVSMEEICEDILATYRKHLPEKDFDTTLFTDFEKAAPRIVMHLVNYAKNETLLQRVPHFCYQDLAIIFYCMLHATDETQANILIHNVHLDMWKTDKDTLYALAMENTPSLLPWELSSMGEVLQECHMQEEFLHDEIPMYILTNRYRTNGASVILYENLLAEISEHFGKDLIILPSSIHEVLLLPTDTLEENELTQYTAMVREVNETQLSDDEILSDHVYYYSRSNRFVSSHTGFVPLLCREAQAGYC